jgi:hypothetical protein
MRFARAIAAIALVTIALSAQAGHADTVGARYVAGTGGDPQRNRVNPLGLTGNNGVGGYDFPGRPGKRPTYVEIHDDVTGKAGIGILVCAVFCSTYQKGFCTNANGRAILPSSIAAGARIMVAVAVVETGMVWSGTQPCDNNAFTGTITVNYV